MKTVIRKGVFETNSSSTHAISISKSDKKEITKGASFEIRSKLAKMVQLFGLINNAEYDCIDSENPKFKIPKKLVQPREIVLKFKEVLIDTYSETTDQSREEALEQIDFEAFSDTYLRDILNDKDKLNEYKLDNFAFNMAFEESEKEDIVEFAKQYYIDDCNRIKSMVGNKIRCDCYFNQGCLNVCDCGMENYIKLQKSLNLLDTDTNEVLKQKAIDFLNDETRFVAKEYWNGVHLEETGDII